MAFLGQLVMAARKRRWIGQGRELLIVLPAALLILVALSTFALFAYRNTVALLIEERAAEATQLARRLAGELTRPPLPSAAELRRRVPLQVRAAAILDQGGELVAATGTRAMPAAPRPRRWLGRADPESTGEDVVSGTARFQQGGQTFTLQVDLAAPILRSRERGLRILTPVLLTMSGAVTLLALAFLGSFMAPFKGLLQRARDAGQEIPESQDEVVFLVENFEKALAALRSAPDRGGPASEVDELKTLEGALARSLASGVLLCDARGTLLALNAVGQELLGLGEPRLGRPLSEALDRHPPLVEILERAVRDGREVKRRECAIATSLGERTLGLTAHPLRRDDAVVRGFLVLFADLTEVQRERAEARLADSLSQVGELAAGVAHELRNSLATLRGYLTLIERQPERESAAGYLAEIRRESDHLQRVLEDFLTFARPGSARPQEVDLVALVHRAAADPALAGAPVEVAAAGGEFRVEGDRQLLERALRNLLSNAVEAQRQSGPGGQRPPVRARLRVRRQGFEIQIDNRGPGLSAEAEKRLFDPFFSERPGGVGMGLALTRRIALLHGGRVALENRAGGGVRATLWLPAGKIDTESNSLREPISAGELPESG